MLKKLVSLLAGVVMMVAATNAISMPFSYNNRPVTVSGNSLQGVLDSVTPLGTINANNDQSRVGAWTMAEANVDAYRVALLSNQGAGKFGVISLKSGLMYDLMTMNNTGSGYTVGFSIELDNSTGLYELYKGSALLDSDFGQTFAFYWSDSTAAQGTHTSFTMDSLNNGAAMALSYLVPDNTDITLHRDSNHTTNTKALGNNDWILAFDNYFTTQNQVTNDFDDAVIYVEDMNPVPEPGTIALLGMGLLGLAIFGKRRLNG